MKLLVGCERSGVVRDAFCRRGWDAYSCDIMPAIRDSSRHIVGDVFDLLSGEWDLLIVHPPCTFLSVSGMHWTTRGLRDPKLTEDAIRFAERLWEYRLKVGRMALENPVGVLSTRSALGKPTQFVQPFEFGDDASKKTGLWLHGLPALKPTKMVPARIVNGRPRWANQTDSGQNRLGPSATRAHERAETYSGIAEAMAEQWTHPK